MPSIKSLFARLEIMNIVKENEERREIVDARLPSVSLFPSVMQYAKEASIRRAKEDSLNSKDLTRRKVVVSQVPLPSASCSQGNIEDPTSVDVVVVDIVHHEEKDQDTLEEEEEEDEKNTTARLHSIRMLLSRSFYTWIDLIYERQEEKQLMKRPLSHWMNLTLSAAFNSWRDFVHERQEEEEEEEEEEDKAGSDDEAQLQE